MRIILFILFFPLICLSQYSPNKKFTYKTKVVSDFGTVNGYYVASTDSTITVSPNKRYLENNLVTIPVDQISQLKVKSKTGNLFALSSVNFVFGFIITAGLTKNGGDVNNNGKTSFWELLFTAIEGATSRNRRRRNTALIVGAAGGATVMLIGLIADNNLSLTFPIKGRQQFYNDNKHKLAEYEKF